MNGTLTLQAIVGKFVAGIDPKMPGRIIEETRNDD
jgi:hypothetical protein